MNRKNVQPRSISGNWFFILLLCIYFILLLSVSFLACFFSYQQKKGELFSEIDTTYVQLLGEYREITDNFWRIYMPISEDITGVQNILKNYFIPSTDQPLSPLDKNALKTALNKMLAQDNNAKWIAVYTSNRSDNYVLYNDNSLIQITEDFPYWSELNSDSPRMEIYGMKHMPNNIATFSICGGNTFNIKNAKIMVGYSIATLDNICQSTSVDLRSLNYVLTNNGNIIYDSSGIYDPAITFCPEKEDEGISINTNQEKLFYHAEICGLRTSLLSYHIASQELFSYCHSLTPLILLIVLIFSFISIAGYMALLHMIRKEVSIIQDGLDMISANHLDYQFTTRFTQSGFHEIAQSINHMTVRLRENINRAYFYEVRQKESELAELQSKFNPHFLYNTLEMLRSRCVQSGDLETAELIAQLGGIFRGFIGSKTFIPMSEELSFSKRYLSLFGARYKNKVTIRYDFDTDILRYGIIRNLFQPLIENYFVHGLDVANDTSYILFSGKSLNENFMVLSVEDNGLGMSDEEITRLNNKLHEPIEISTESYGLKNLHQRIQLFYGENCGITVCKNSHSKNGLCVQMTVLKLTCEEYEKNKANSSFHPQT